jgi:hypothetical protein
MHIFKRVEVWFLLALIIAGLVFVLKSERSHNEPDPLIPIVGPPDSSLPKAKSFSLNEIRLKRDYENAIIELSLTVDNKNGAEFQLIPPHAQLLAGPADDSNPDPGQLRPIEPFFLAFSPPPLIPAGQIASADLKYWLEPRDLLGPLWLQIQDERQLVKAAASFNLDSLENQSTTTVTPPDWPQP